MAVVDYAGIEQALANLFINSATLQALGTDGRVNVFVNAMERDMIFNNMPLMNVRLTEDHWDMVEIPNGYYADVCFEVDVIAYHFTSFLDAAKLRDSILSTAKDVVRTTANRKFHSSLDTSMLHGRTRFGALTPPGGGGHVALATFQVHGHLYIDAL